MEVIQRFKEICEDPKAYARRWKEKTGGKVVGTFCSYAPEELVLAGGALAFRIVGGSGSISKADAYLQSYSCSLVRGALDDALNSTGIVARANSAPRPKMATPAHDKPGKFNNNPINMKIQPI